jgi:hypothetical protein
MFTIFRKAPPSVVSTVMSPGVLENGGFVSVRLIAIEK